MANDSQEKPDASVSHRYARAIYAYLMWFSVSSFILLLLVGFKVGEFYLPENVLIALVISIPLAAIGLTGFMIIGIFKSPK